MTPETRNQINQLALLIPEQPLARLYKKSSDGEEHFLHLSLNDESDDLAESPMLITFFTDDKKLGDLHSHWQIRFNNDGEPVYFGDMDGSEFSDDDMIEHLAPFIEQFDSVG